MSEPRPTRDPDTQPIPRVRVRGGERRRAALALLVLAVIAVGVVALMVKLLGGSKGTPLAGPSDTYTGPPVTHVSSSSPPQSSNSAPSTQPETSQSSTGPSGRHVSCPSSAPCPLKDDIGDVLGALNSYRQQHALPPVQGTVTTAAATCAATAASVCPSGFHWEPVGRSGRQVIDKIAARGGGELAFLLDPTLKRVQIGWAFVPASHSFYCALVANTP
jgi:hypothetical protein